MTHFTPESFWKAVKKERLDEVKECLSVHPEWVHLQTKGGETSFHLAAKTGNEPIFKVLLSTLGAVISGVGFDMMDIFGETPLYVAIVNGNEPIVKLLLQVGSDIDAVIHDLWHSLRLLFNIMTERKGKAIGESIGKLLKAVGASDKYQVLPISEAEILELRFDIYFQRSLLDRLLFHF